jgi:hypothetical protein
MTNRIRMTVLTVALLPFLTLAAPPEADAQRESERAERQERRHRTMRVLGLAEELELDTAQALRLDETLRKFDERRRPLREQVRESARILRSAAEGDAAAASQVDAAAQRAFDARAQLAALDRELFQALSKDLPPQKKARLALFLARSHGPGHGPSFKMRDPFREEMRQERREMRRRLRDGRG